MRYRMNFALALAFALSGATCVCFAASAAFHPFQQGAGRGPITAPRDPETEKQSAKSLEAAKFYFYKRQPANKNDAEGWARLNKAVESRLQEIIDINPNFARIDEVYFMLGEVYKRMGELDKAVENWTKASQETSDEKLKAQIQKRLDEAKAQNKDQKRDN
ncbi:MAG TPA: tetratricopeptide repeat protein [Blastocatellia bacterium]